MGEAFDVLSIPTPFLSQSDGRKGIRSSLLRRESGGAGGCGGGGDGGGGGSSHSAARGALPLGGEVEEGRGKDRKGAVARW